MDQDTLQTCLYYTFSTIAQSLATGLGLLAAFVLFKLDNLSKSLETALGNIFSGWKDDEAFRHYLDGNWKGFFETYKSTEFYRSIRVLQKNLSDVGFFVKEIPAIRKDLLNTVKITSAIIAISVGILCLVPLISMCIIVTICVLALGFGMTSFALQRFYSLISSAITEKKIPAQ